MRAGTKRGRDGFGGWPLEICLWVAGAWGWATFLRFGHLPFWFADWRQERFYTEALTRWVRGDGGTLHLEASLHGTARWLAVPLVPLTPDVWLLRWLPPGGFLVVHALLAFSIGCLGLHLIRRRYALSWPAFLLLWVAFNGNGFLAPKLAVGHLVWWVGWFALPWALLGVLEWVERGPGIRPTIIIAGSLAGAALAGSFHLVTWFALFIILLSVARTGWWKWGALTLAAISGLTAFRWIPGWVAFPGMTFGIANGFPSFAVMGEALAVSSGPGRPTIGGAGWWEFDAFAGGSGCLWLLALGVLPLLDRIGREAPGHPPAATHRPLWLPMLGLTVLAWDQAYWWLFDRIPPFSGERVTSRLLAIPVAVGCVLAAVRTEGLLRRWRHSAWLTMTILALAAIMGFELLIHARHWGLTETMAGWGTGSRDRWPDPVFTVVRDPAYRAALAAGWSVTMASVAVAGMAWWRTRKCGL